MAAAVIAAGASPAALAQTSELEVGVRTKVIDKIKPSSGKSKSQSVTGRHARVYGILAVKEIKADNELVTPVNEQELLELLSIELNKQGFQLYAPGQKPDILITASYGRGELENPYIRDGGETGGDGRA